MTFQRHDFQKGLFFALFLLKLLSFFIDTHGPWEFLPDVQHLEATVIMLGVGLAVFGYCFIVAFFAYFCVLANPDDSKLAMLFQVELPMRLWQGLHRCAGDRALNVVGFFFDRFMVIIYCIVVFGCWSIIFANVYPWMDRQDRLSKNHKYVGYAVFVACVASWRLASRTSPGIITAKNLQRYNHYPYDNFMFPPDRICKTRNIPKLARSKFDRNKYHENVARFDHYCGWVFNTIGEENYRFFLLFLAVHVGMTAYGTYALSQLFYGVVLEKRLLEVTFFDRYSGEEIKTSKWIVFQYLFTTYLAEASVLIVMAVMSVALGLFSLYHVWLTSRGFTTNESYRWGQVQKWYNAELKRYNDAVKNGQAQAVCDATDAIDAVDTTNKGGGESSNSNRQRQPTVVDGDVTCTGGNGKSAAEDGDRDDYDDDDDDNGDDQAVMHPGPRPVNIYNRGFVENWKEVIFPIPLRKAKNKAKEP